MINEGGMQEIRAEDSWHLKKEVSLATLGMIVANLIMVVMFASKMDSRISVLESQNITDGRVGRLEVMLDNETRARRDLEARTLIALEEIKALLRESIREREARETRRVTGN
jgi:hypothetical protein